MSTAVYTHADCRAHDMGRGHPECPERLDAILDHLRAQGLDMALAFEDAPLALPEQIDRAHAAAYRGEITEFMRAIAADEDPGAHRGVDADTSANRGTLNAAYRAAGAAVAATDAVLAGRYANAFCAVRPPGHHATHDQAMGFCFFNNVAVAARHALDVHGLERVAVIDFDVHHGNGTEDIVAGDDRILMLSFFQHPLYPYSGDVPKGPNMLNLPMAPYTRGPAVRDAIREHWLPRLEAFSPQMIFISAGFDAHRDDDLGQMGLVEADYAWITEQLLDVAERHGQGRIVSCLEGGYHLGALARSVAAHLRVLAGVA
ncbi:MAG: histone deacetylase family protein [Rubrivivax sp.]|jgi:acetoin utilization deacetylase AcuC-like enzyme|nr:histone deacetylase family protein [Rubrivivax sp.]